MTLDLRLDVRSAPRGLRRGGSAALVAILTLAIGIGVVTAAFAVIDAVVFRPLVEKTLSHSRPMQPVTTARRRCP